MIFPYRLPGFPRTLFAYCTQARGKFFGNNKKVVRTSLLGLPPPLDILHIAKMCRPPIVALSVGSASRTPERLNGSLVNHVIAPPARASDATRQRSELEHKHFHPNQSPVQTLTAYTRNSQSGVRGPWPTHELFQVPVDDETVTYSLNF
jgi:hypothetical protein